MSAGSERPVPAGPRDGRSALWERVQAALDARRDPLADEAVLEALAAEPEAAPELARLLERVDALRRAERARPRELARPSRAPAQRAFARLAAAVVVVSALAAVRPRSARVEREPASHAAAAGPAAPAPTPAARSRVLSWRVTLVSAGPAGRETRTADARGETRALDLPDGSAAPDGARVVALRASRELHGARTP